MKDAKMLPMKQTAWEQVGTAPTHPNYVPLWCCHHPHCNPFSLFIVFTEAQMQWRSCHPLLAAAQHPHLFPSQLSYGAKVVILLS